MPIRMQHFKIMAFDWSIGFSAKRGYFFVFNWASFDAKQHCIAVSCKISTALSVQEHFQKINIGSTNDNEIIPGNYSKQSQSYI